MSPTWASVSTHITSAAPSRRRYCSQMLEISCHERQARSARIPAFSPASGRSTVKVGALLFGGGAAVGFLMKIVSDMPPPVSAARSTDNREVTRRGSPQRQVDGLASAQRDD